MDNHLADQRHITLILRLAIDRDAQLVYGELVDLAGVSIGHFMEWPKLTEVIQTWLTSQGNGQTHHNPDNQQTN